MTLSNIAVTAKRALVASDTLLYTPDGGPKYQADGAPWEVTKLFAFSQGNFVLSGQGSHQVFTFLAHQLGSSVSLDDALTRMPNLLEACAQHMATFTLNGSTDRGERIWLVGWSAERGHMLSAAWNTTCGFKDIDGPQIAGSAAKGQSSYSFSPNPPNLSQMPLPRDVETMRECAFSQVQHHRDIDYFMPFGGRIVVAELTEQGIALSCAGELGIPKRKSAESGSIDLADDAMHALAPVTTFIDAGTHSGTATPGPSISYDTGFITVVTANSRGNMTHVRGNASISITLPGTTVELIGANLLIRRDGTTLLHNKNVNGKPATVSGNQSIQFVMPFDVTFTPTAGAHSYEFRWLLNWVNNTSGTVTVTGLSASYGVDMDVIAPLSSEPS